MFAATTEPVLRGCARLSDAVIHSVSGAPIDIPTPIVNGSNLSVEMCFSATC